MFRLSNILWAVLICTFLSACSVPSPGSVEMDAGWSVLAHAIEGIM